MRALCKSQPLALPTGTPGNGEQIIGGQSLNGFARRLIENRRATLLDLQKRVTRGNPSCSAVVLRLQ
jgi:hypothetical protein